MLKSSSFSSFFDINLNGDKMNYKNCFIIFSIYISLILTLPRILLIGNVSIMCKISAYIFTIILLLFIFLLIINYIEIKYQLNLLEKDNKKLKSRRQFNLWLSRSYQKKFKPFSLCIKIKPVNLPEERAILRSILRGLDTNNTKAIYKDKSNVLYVLASDLNSTLKDITKTIYIDNKKVSVLDRIKIYNNSAKFI